MRRILFVLLLFTCFSVFGQNAIIAGPMIGHVELRSAMIWMQSNSKGAHTLKYKPTNSKQFQNAEIIIDIDQVNNSYITKFSIGGLEPGTTYDYQVVAGTKVLAAGTFQTQQLWQWRKPAPDFSFIAGSCSYFNDLTYERPGRLYGHDSSIYESMASEKADFMLWLGDNWYTREVDYYSKWGLNYRASKDRSMKVLQPFLRAMPHYAIWDDHDYGWNNADKSYPLKSESREIFKKFWCNPSYGENNEGVYTKITWNDVDIFMLDDRWFRTHDMAPDSVNGQPNEGKLMFGKAQMEWLKNALLTSKHNTNISFRIIATGSQVLNPLSTKDCMRHYPLEFEELIKFIGDNKVDGILFLTGDRHHSEVIKINREGAYPLYDVTSSALTAGISTTTGIEKNNPYRVSPEITVHNYARLSVTGLRNERKLTVEYLDKKGVMLTSMSILKKEISN